MAAPGKTQSVEARTTSTHLLHWRPPKVIGEYVAPRSVRPQIFVLLNRTDIVEHESAIEAVVVAAEAGHHDQRPENTLR